MASRALTSPTFLPPFIPNLVAVRPGWGGAAGVGQGAARGPGVRTDVCRGASLWLPRPLLLGPAANISAPTCLSSDTATRMSAWPSLVPEPGDSCGSAPAPSPRPISGLKPQDKAFSLKMSVEAPLLVLAKEEPVMMELVREKAA